MRLPVPWRVVITLTVLMAAGLVVLSIYLTAQGYSGRLIGAIWLWGAAVTAAAARLRLTTRSAGSRVRWRSVVDGARRLARGDFEHRIPTVPTSEAGEMADSFNAMAATIRNMVRDLSGERNKLSDSTEYDG